MTNEEIQYNQYLIDNITHYLVTEFVGRGQYKKTKFDTFDNAKDFYQSLKLDNPITKTVIYGISEPIEKPYPINVMMEV